MNIQSCIIILITSMLLYACASPQPLTGGAEDKTPPQLDTTYPTNKSVFFKSQQIVLTFDEKVAVNNFQEGLIISPNTDVTITATAKKNRVTLKIQESLEYNKTYSIFMRNSIQDITENNKIPLLKYIFSTGEYLDSLTISGTAKNLLENKTTADASVLLYAASDTIDIKTDPPLYYTKTNKDGSYLFENLPPGTYNIFYLNDRNGTLLFDDPAEEIGFLNETLELKTHLEKIDISVFKNDNTPPNITVKQDCGFSTILPDEPINFITITDTNYTNLNLNPVSTFGNELIFHNTIESDSLYTNIIFSDNSENRDTIQTLIYKEQLDKKCTQPIGLQLVTRNINNTDSIIFKCNYPINYINTSSIILYADSVLIDTLKNLKHNINNTELVIQPGENEATKFINMVFDSASVKTVSDNIPFDSISIKAQIADPTQVGKMSGALYITEDHPFIIELLDNNSSIIKTCTNKQFIFQNLKPGDYSIRVKIDENHNGQFEPGKLESHKIPEKIVFHSEQINMRANWEIDGIWIKVD